MRPTLLFLGGFVLAVGLARAADAVACCMQMAENAPVTLTAYHVDGVPTDAPGWTRYDPNLSAGYDGISLSYVDEEGYQVGGEEYRRRTP